MPKKKTIKESIEKAVQFGQDKMDTVSDTVIHMVDQNGDGKIGIEDFIILALQKKAIRVNRDDFLRNAFSTMCDKKLIEKAIATNPAKAGIKVEFVRKAAENAINKQTKIVTSTSVGLGYVPGPVIVDVTTTVADVTQYYGNLLIMAQKLLYLYGFPEIEISDGKNITLDDGTMNLLIICLGAMAGVNEACQVLNKMAELLAKGVQKKMMQKALTKQTLWPILKKILSYFTITLTKDLASKTVANSIKLLGGALVGGITYYSFTKCGKNFIGAIDNTILSNPVAFADDKQNIVDAEYTEDSVSEELVKNIVIEE